ncbi:MAG: hypothetical protein K8W52_12560 [Deltaproteobacteria bacterium]|nr:hypothetical protein [Deltaproteobacteria bacterium]
MKRAVAAAALMLMGCATSYEAATSHRGLGGGAYLIEAEGNVFTSRTTITEYLYQRADELCAAGFSVMDSDRATEQFTDPQGNISSRSSGTLAIVCARPSHAGDEDEDEDEDDDPPRPAATPAERRIVTGSRPIYCTHSASDPDVGTCSPIEATCQAARDARTAAGETYTPCEAAPAAACFNAVRVLSGEKSTHCATSIAHCDQELAALKANPDYTVAAARCGIYKATPAPQP